ncbi:hypothetical protein LguiA_031620 [Lonicera macranthoides]
MDKICEFCMASRPVVYCKSDAAHLCLSCDARIHSANALSGRHSRTLLCESCRYRRAYIRCSTHQIFMCRGCDRSQHQISSQHEKQEIRSYMGCPSAKDLAALWGFDLNELEDSTLQDQFVSTESEVGSSSHKTKAFYNGKRQENRCLILQQILALRRLQLTVDGKNLSLMRRQEETEISASKYDNAWKCEHSLDQHLQRSLGLGSDLQQMENSNQDLNVESYSLQFSLLDQMNSSSTVGNSLQGDAFWQCKSPVQSGQLWSQNMQDLGVCEELGYLDDMSIPDVDLTFRNFEELFGGEQEPAGTLLVDDKDAPCSSMEKDTSADGSDNNVYERPKEDFSVGSSAYITQSAQVEDIDPPQRAHYVSRCRDVPCSIQPSYSTLSFSHSRLGGESSGTDYKENKHPPISFGKKPSSNLTNKGDEQLESKENARRIYKEKKARRHEKQVQYASRKARANEVGRRLIS